MIRNRLFINTGRLIQWRIFRIIPAVAFLVLAICSCVTSRSVYVGDSTVSLLKPGIRLAVVGLNLRSDTSGDQEVKKRSQEIDMKLVDMLSTALFKGGHFDLVERDEIDRVFEEQRLQLSDVVDPATVVEIGKILDAQAIITVVLEDISLTPISYITVCSSTVRVQVIDAEIGRPVLIISGTGRSFTGGIPIKAMILTGTTQKHLFGDLFGIKRQFEDMLNTALRRAVGKVAKDISRNF